MTLRLSPSLLCLCAVLLQPALSAAQAAKGTSATAATAPAAPAPSASAQPATVPSPPAAATVVPAHAKLRVNLPPPAELTYNIRARQRGITVEGSAVVRWNTSGRNFSVTSETRAKLLGKILDARTEGTVDDYGLAPVSFNEKRFSKAATATSFDRNARVISFSAVDGTHPMQGGEQDRNSIVWQLVSVARAAPARFKPGSEWNFVVAGQRDADHWTFKVGKTEKLSTPAGELDAVQVTRLPPDGKGQQLDLWLAPQRDWYPVRVRFSDDSGDYIDQRLERIERKK